MIIIEVEVFKDEKYAAVFDNDAIFIIPTADKPVKMIFPDKYTIKETENGFVATETISVKDAINRVKAANNDPHEVIDIINTLLKDGKWKGMIV